MTAALYAHHQLIDSYEHALDGRDAGLQLGSGRTLTGTDAPDSLSGGTKDNLILGLGGNDTLSGGGGDDTVHGGGGDDLIMVSLTSDASGHDFDLATGDGGADTLLGGSGLNLLSGGGGADSVVGGSGDDVLRGDAGADTLDSGGGNVDILEGGGGADVLYGREANAHIEGGDGRDVMYGIGVFDGGAGNDRWESLEYGLVTISGGEGNDILINHNAVIFADGGSGHNLIEYDGADHDYHIDMTAATNGKAQTVGGGHFVNYDQLVFHGSGGDDWLAGANRPDTLQGGAGDDTLIGRGGDDSLDAAGGDSIDDGINVLDGGAGRDTLNGADGHDRLTGGSGADLLDGQGSVATYVYTAVKDSMPDQRDTIESYSFEDQIDLSSVDANWNEAGDQAFVRVSAFGGHAGELMVQTHGGSDLILGDVDGDGKADLEIVVRGHHDYSDMTL